jgi:hypothetical protein
MMIALGGGVAFGGVRVARKIMLGSEVPAVEADSAPVARRVSAQPTRPVATPESRSR